MALRATVTGHIADPTLRWTAKQQAVLELRVNATAAEKDRNTGQWSDVGEQLWVSATFWDEEAQSLEGALNKGDRVTVTGTLVIESYKRRDGGTGQSYVLRYPRFMGVIPPRRPQRQDAGSYTPSAAPF